MRSPGFLLLITLCLAPCGCERATQAAPLDDTAKIEAARKVARGFRAALEEELRLAIETAGAATAIGVCSERAPALAAAAATSEFTVRRVGTRVRNKRSNAPSKEDQEVLAALRAVPADKLPQAQEVRTRDGRFAVYLPIVIADGRCLLCHGPVDELAPDVRQKLAELYPDDEATGYAVGDLRGALVVEGKR